MKTFQVEFRYQDRKNGPVETTVKLDASSLPGAIAKTTREFVKGLDRKQRFDIKLVQNRILICERKEAERLLA